MVQSNQLSKFIWLKYDTDEQTLVGVKSWGLLFVLQLRKKKELFMHQCLEHRHQRGQGLAVDEVREGAVSWRCCLTGEAWWNSGCLKGRRQCKSQGKGCSALICHQLWRPGGSGAAVSPRGHREGQRNSDTAWETLLTGSQAEDNEVRSAAQEQTCSWVHEVHCVGLSKIPGMTLMREMGPESMWRTLIQCQPSEHFLGKWEETSFKHSPLNQGSL